MSTAAVLRPEVWHQGGGPVPRAVPAPVRVPGQPWASGGPVTGPPGGDARARFAAVVQPNLDDAFALARWLTGNRADA